MITVRSRRPSVAPRGEADSCEQRHRPIQSLVWQVFGGFVMVVLTLALAGAGQLGRKADADDVRAVAVRAGEVERAVSEIRSGVAALRAGQEHIREELRYIRKTLDEEREP